MNRKNITLTTDFGDGIYVPQMKGVIKKINAEIDLTDITHNVKPQNIVEGAFILSRIWDKFPKSTVHIAVVDPKVGTKRNAVAVETEYCTLIGPDNGILCWSLKDQKILRMIKIDFEKISGYTENKILSKTFHGRDIFAPCAALLCNGIDLDNLGERITDLETLQIRDNTVVHIDGFGNIITTNVLELEVGADVQITHKGKSYIAKAAETFEDGEKNELIILQGSHGLLEIDVNCGNAAKKLNAKVGDEIGVEDAS